jgi:hypothetical protein
MRISAGAQDSQFFSLLAGKTHRISDGLRQARGKRRRSVLQSLGTFSFGARSRRGKPADGACGSGPRATEQNCQDVWRRGGDSNPRYP